MYHLIKSVISAGGFKFNDIRHKIHKFYLLGNITEAEAEELLTLAAGSVSVEAERPEYLTMIQHLAAAVAALTVRVNALDGVAGDAGAYPVWKSWDGISADYACGAIVIHKDLLWKSVFPGQNVWEPGTTGEGFWIVYTE